MEFFSPKTNQRLAVGVFHFAIFIGGIVIAILVVKTGIVHEILEKSSGIGLWGSFLAGIFFTTILTAAPATVIFFELGKSGIPIIPMALIAGAGALIGDFILFHFLKMGVTDSLVSFLKDKSHGRMKKLWRLKWFSWTMAIVGGIIIASPFPDEIGLALMGIGRVNQKIIAVLSYTLNTAGIFVVALLGRLAA